MQHLMIHQMRLSVVIVALGMFPICAFFAHIRAHTNGGVKQRPLLRRVLRRVLETAFEKVPRRVPRRCLAMGLMGRRVLRRVLRRGSKKGLLRRHLEGRSTPFREYDPVGVCPIHMPFLLPIHNLDTLEQRNEHIDQRNHVTETNYLPDPSLDAQIASDFKSNPLAISNRSDSNHCDFSCDFYPLLHRFRVGFGCDFAGALRFQTWERKR